MIRFKVEEQLKCRKMSRYRLQKITGWNYKRINAFFNSEVIQINIFELNQLCELFACRIEDLMEYKKD